MRKMLGLFFFLDIMKYDIFKYMFSVTDAKVMNIYNVTQVLLIFLFLLTNYTDYSTVTRTDLH